MNENNLLAQINSVTSTSLLKNSDGTFNLTVGHALSVVLGAIFFWLYMDSQKPKARRR
ncbi:hypothetical protein [Cloacibacterium normanense]|uniref:hypothetical protein n=1 Tax=Cloacibacterium normanense TaxID=237258 RepID=UPI0013FD6F1F|nr:hypothetical protein [Cloacibacterium normanense]